MGCKSGPAFFAIENVMQGYDLSLTRTPQSLVRNDGARGHVCRLRRFSGKSFIKNMANRGVFCVSIPSQDNLGIL